MKMERIDTLKAFVAKERSTMKSFNDPKNIEKHKWYIKESLTNMKGEMLREIDSLLQDKRVTLMRQYNNHNDSLRKEISELESERKEIYNFKFNDGAIMKNAKVKSYLAQEFRDLKARLSKKAFKDAITIEVKVEAIQQGDKYGWVAYEKGHIKAANSFYTYNTAEEAIKEGKKYLRGSSNDKFHWVVKDNKSKWIDGLAIIKDSLKKFKDSYDIIRKHIKHNGCDISIIETGPGSFKFLVEKDGKKKKSVNVFFSQLEAEDEAKHTAESFNDSAEYINDRKIDIKRDGKLIDVVNAESLDEAVRIYERQHPELRGQIDAYFSDAKVEDDTTTFEGYKIEITESNYNTYGYKIYKSGSLMAEGYGWGSRAKALETAKAKIISGEIEDAKVKDVSIKDFISYDKDWAERMFKAGYSARETAMRIEAYNSSTNHSEQADLINRLEKHRKEWFERRLEEVRAGRK